MGELFTPGEEGLRPAGGSGVREADVSARSAGESGGESVRGAGQVRAGGGEAGGTGPAHFRSPGRWGSVSEEVPGEGGGAARTWQVLLLLVGSAAVLSFLVSYAVTDVLVRADVMARWPVGSDPRPRWMAVGFCVLLGVFGVVGAVARQLSRAQLKRIDAMAD